VTKPGGRCDRTVDFMSVFPTLCDLAGLPTPAHAKGPSLRPLLVNPAAKWDLPGITTFHLNNHGVRTEQFRYIRYADGGEEFYDHNKDPYEWTNLAKNPAYATQKAALMKLLPADNVAERPNTADGEGKKRKKEKNK